MVAGGCFWLEQDVLNRIQMLRDKLHNPELIASYTQWRHVYGGCPPPWRRKKRAPTASGAGGGRQRRVHAEPFVSERRRVGEREEGDRTERGVSDPRLLPATRGWHTICGERTLADFVGTTFAHPLLCDLNLHSVTHADLTNLYRLACHSRILSCPFFFSAVLPEVQTKVAMQARKHSFHFRHVRV